MIYLMWRISKNGNAFSLYMDGNRQKLITIFPTSRRLNEGYEYFIKYTEEREGEEKHYSNKVFDTVQEAKIAAQQDPFFLECHFVRTNEEINVENEYYTDENVRKRALEFLKSKQAELARKDEDIRRISKIKKESLHKEE